MISVENLSKTMAGTEIIKRITFSLRPHKITALLGMNGAGKTTTLHILAEIMKPDAGRIVMHDTVRDVRTEIGFLPQHPTFHGWMNACEYVTMAGELGGLPRKEAVKRAETVLIQTGLQESTEQRISEFSGGMKQRLGIAQAIIHRPRLLLLDEPMSALDPQGRKDIVLLLAELKKTTTILYSTHILHDAEQIADDILMMNKGEIAAFERLDKLMSGSSNRTFTVHADVPLDDWGKLLRKHYPEWTIYVSETKAEIEGPSAESAMQAKVMGSLIENRIAVRSLTAGSQSLDTLFREVMEHV
ncbi:ABC transporter ATP-binding protein [Sinobaca sp. H24]|uniref:ABC transporter ATP-binding protein n=1 Tax=Sinobaca sp. H24 TaxID=2923376 RepID=UPI002079545A|nr:ABC transporter ATP-binding protein [Sinobaca sp. H24]